MPYTQIAGSIMDIIGTVKGAKEASRRAEILRNLPGYQSVNVSNETRQAIQDNLGNLDKSSKLAGAASDIDQANLMKQLRAAIPNYDSIMAGGGKAIDSMLRGELSDEVKAQVARGAAQRSLAGGYGGTGMARNLEARDLGLTSLNLTQTGIDKAMGWLQTARATSVAGPTSVSSMFITPQNRIEAAFRNSENQYTSAMNQAFGKATPGMDAYYAQNLQRVGGQLMGGSMGGGGGGGGMGSMLSSFGGSGK